MRVLKTKQSSLYIGNDIFGKLKDFIEQGNYSRVFILVDENTVSACLPVLHSAVPMLRNAVILKVKSGEKNKNIETCVKIWSALSNASADRYSLLINLGGGVICDMGGFIASAYLRGIRFIHVPTTLLSQVDAAVGGKTGVNLGEVKNRIGFFSFPKAVFVYPRFLSTLPSREMRSGFAEVIKCALIADKLLWERLEKRGFLAAGDEKIIMQCICIKEKIVSRDPYETGERKLLNFGHTAGHAIETWSLLNDRKPLLHGEAVAAGMIIESRISSEITGLPPGQLDDICRLVIKQFGKYPLPAYTKLIRLMEKDKKNRSGKISFTLLSRSGRGVTGHYCGVESIRRALEFYDSL